MFGYVVVCLHSALNSCKCFAICLNSALNSCRGYVICLHSAELIMHGFCYMFTRVYSSTIDFKIET